MQYLVATKFCRRKRRRDWQDYSLIFLNKLAVLMNLIIQCLNALSCFRLFVAKLNDKKKQFLL